MKTAIVLGVSRCGSSLVAHILHTLGVYMGPTFIEADEYNKRGYWEDSTIMNIQERMLNSVGRNWWNPPRSEHEICSISDSFLVQLDSVFKKRMEQAQANGQGWWGWKDPRTHWLLPLYKDFLINPHFIFVHRNILSIAKSVYHRDKSIIKTFDSAMDLVMNHYAMLGGAFDYTPHLHIGYEETLDAPDGVVNNIDRFLCMNSSSYTKSIAEECVKPELRTW